ncbi:MAG TPA: hypothetical protein DCY35_04010 [Prolixibacteraceae bacterium]|nr:hypothetical protein [Prolixibacteraceae bacterium]
MKHKTILILLTSVILVMASIAAGTGIFSNEGPGPFEYKSIHGESVQIYGKGVYSYMSAELAPQGIAQDFITLFLALPVLLISLVYSLKGSVRGKLVHTGVTSYLFVTYLFYLAMGTYSYLFLVYVILLGSTAASLTLGMLSLGQIDLPGQLKQQAPVKAAGSFLIFNGLAIGLLWLGRVVPPLIDGTIYPEGLDHYTTMIVQGFDLALLLPLSIVSGFLLYQRNEAGILLGIVYLVFLSILMTSLTAKIIYMGILGQNIIPVVFIIPVFMLTAYGFSYSLIKKLRLN